VCWSPVALVKEDRLTKKKTPVVLPGGNSPNLLAGLIKIHEEIRSIHQQLLETEIFFIGVDEAEAPTRLEV
jgi:hypothetical protein